MKGLARRARTEARRQLYRRSYLAYAWLEAKRLAPLYGVPLGRDKTIDGPGCVFVHIPKNGGTSIIEALGRHGVRHSHATAALVSARGQRDRLMFAVVRNPWDRLTSAFRYLTDERLDHPYYDDDPKVIWKANARFDTFREFVLSLDARKIRSLNLLQPQHYFVCDRKGKLMVDEILRFESLDEDFSSMAKRHGLPFEALPRRNATATHTRYREYYDDVTRQRVADLYAEDIEMFGYAFREPSGDSAERSVST